jgi:hypothetical protein
VSFLSPGSGFYRVNVDGGPSCSVDDVRGAPDRSRKVDGRNLRKAGIVATLEVITVSEPTF